MKKLDNVPPNAFKECFIALFKLYDNLKADFEQIIGEQAKNLLFFNAFSAENCNMAVAILCPSQLEPP